MHSEREYFTISGMSCSACSARVGRAVSALDGVVDVNVNLLKNTMRVDFDPASTSAPDIVAAVSKAGYGAQIHTSRNTGRERADTGTVAEKRRLIASLIFTIPLVYLAMGPMFALPLPGFFQGDAQSLPLALTQFLLTLPVLCINAAIFRAGFKTLLARAPNMDSLIALGSGAAVVFSVFGAHLYFDSAAMILTLIRLGKFFEARAKGKSTEAITRLMDLAPQTATVLRSGEELVILREEIALGDILLVKAGERVPVDGLITEGYGFLDESALSGESLPLEKRPGDPVTGATINVSGHFHMQATRVGENTTLAQIIKLVDEATSSRAPIARLADRISGVFVPVVIAIALVATVTWLLLGQNLEFALSTGIAVLVISCPCALGLATPTAIMVGTGRGAAHGILLKSAEAIERAGSIDTIVLDKTGTVTQGRPVVTDILPTLSETELLTLAASLEKLSEHPLGAPIVREAEERGLALYPVQSFMQIPGQGISGSIDGIAHTAGNAAMLQAQGIPNTLSEAAESLALEGKTVLYFTRGGFLLGCIALADAIKPGSAQAVAELTRMGMELILLTGDNARTAEAVRRSTGIPTVLAELLPQDKEREIRALQDLGKKVAMVGDGVNDAPALARADVGIAIGAGTDVAIESADIVLMKSDLLDAVGAVQLSRAVMRTIRQNLFWAFFYNCVGIPVAAGVLYTAFGWRLNPMIAAAAMSVSSVSVVGNALRLRLFKPQHTLPQPEPQRIETMKKTLRIDGMNCGHCTASVEKALRALPGVSAVQVDLAAKSAFVDGMDLSDEAMQKAVTDLGFDVVEIL